MRLIHHSLSHHSLWVGLAYFIYDLKLVAAVCGQTHRPSIHHVHLIHSSSQGNNDWNHHISYIDLQDEFAIYQDIVYLHSHTLSVIKLIGEAHHRHLCANGFIFSHLLSLHFSGHFLLLTELRLKVSRNPTFHFSLTLLVSHVSRSWSTAVIKNHLFPSACVENIS